MKINSLIIQNNPILGNLLLDFRDSNGDALDNIIFAGENGCGKSTILEILFDFSRFQPITLAQEESRLFQIELNVNELKKFNEISGGFSKIHTLKPVLSIKFSSGFSDWNQISVMYTAIDGTQVIEPGGKFSIDSVRKLFLGVYVDVEINFRFGTTQNVTSLDLDRPITQSIKSTNSTATQIQQLLVDIQPLDDMQLAEWARSHVGLSVDLSQTDNRLQRFNNAFNYMFPDMKYKGVRTGTNGKRVIFEQFPLQCAFAPTL